MGNEIKVDAECVAQRIICLIQSGEHFIYKNPLNTLAGRNFMFRLMLEDVKETETHVNKIALSLTASLLDPYKLNYSKLAKRLQDLENAWRDEFNDPASDINLGLKRIAQLLRDIAKNQKNLLKDEALQENVYLLMQTGYNDNDWSGDENRLKRRVDAHVKINKCNDPDTFKCLLNLLDLDATDPDKNELLVEMNQRFKDGKSVAAFIVSNRDKLTESDIRSHFRYVKYHNTLSAHIKRFEFSAPPDAKYAGLFTSKAAELLTTLILPTIIDTADFKHKYQYVGLYMALIDLRLIFADNRNSLTMLKYINSKLDKHSVIKDLKTFSQWTNKLFSRRFCTLDEDHLQGTVFGLEEFKKIKDYYWLCISIINKVLQQNLQELDFVPYLLVPHSNTPIIEKYIEYHNTAEVVNVPIYISIVKKEPSLFA